MEYGCIGEVLKHSFSAEIHSKLFGYKYELCEIKKSEIDNFLKQRNFKAVNVTIPYKQTVMPYLYSVDDIAKKTGAVNTIVNNNGKLYGYNTDYSGLRALILKNNIDLKNKKVLIAGSGGTSKTAAAVARSLEAKEIYRLSRNDAAHCISYENALKYHSDTDVIINTTPCGMFPKIGSTALDIKNFSNLCAVVDVVYNPLRSKLVTDAEKRGITAVGGLYMLVAQAAFAAEKFTGKSVDPLKIDNIYTEILKSKENIVLIGMPGCGKTTIGNLTAKELKREFVDTDDLITKTVGMPIAEYFKNFGEWGFRKLESDVIKQISARQSLVIATGGGAVLNSKNIDLLRENGRVYFIDRPLDDLVISPDRPLSSNRADLEKRFLERYDTYVSSADKTINNTDCAAQVAGKIIKEFFA